MTHNTIWLTIPATWPLYRYEELVKGCGSDISYLPEEHPASWNCFCCKTEGAGGCLEILRGARLWYLKTATWVLGLVLGRLVSKQRESSTILNSMQVVGLLSFLLKGIERSFWGLVSNMHDPSYLLLYWQDFELSHKDVGTLEQGAMPDLHSHSEGAYLSHRRKLSNANGGESPWDTESCLVLDCSCRRMGGQ